MLNNKNVLLSNCNTYNRGEKTPPHKNKFDFKCFTQNTLCSLNCVEYFLNNFSHCYKFVRLYKLLH